MNRKLFLSNVAHAPGIDCGYKHYLEAGKLEKVTCPRCMRLIREGGKSTFKESRSPLSDPNLSVICNQCGKPMVKQSIGQDGESTYVCFDYPKCQNIKKITFAKLIKVSKEIPNSLITKNMSTITGLTSVISDILRSAVNKRISVKDQPITKLLKDAEVSLHFSSTLLDVLAEKGLIFREGERAGIYYTVLTDVIPDPQVLATECYNRYKEENKKSREQKKLDLEDGKVTTRAYRKKSIEKGEIQNGTSTIVRRRTPSIGDIMYMMNDNRVCEVRVYGVQENETTGAIECHVEHFNHLEEIEEDIPYTGWKATNTPHKSLFDSPEILVQRLLATVLKHIKRR